MGSVSFRLSGLRRRRVVRLGAPIAALSLVGLAVASHTSAGTLGGEPPDFVFAVNQPTFVAVVGANTVDGTLGPTPGDPQDPFNVTIPIGLEVTSVTYSGPSGSHNLVGCGLAGVSNLNQTFSPPQTGCTMSWFITTDFAPSSAAWTVTINVQVDPGGTTTTTSLITTTSTSTSTTTSTSTSTTTSTTEPPTTTSTTTTTTEPPTTTSTTTTTTEPPTTTSTSTSTTTSTSTSTTTSTTEPPTTTSTTTTTTEPPTTTSTTTEPPGTTVPPATTTEPSTTAPPTTAPPTTAPPTTAPQGATASVAVGTIAQGQVQTGTGAGFQPGESVRGEQHSVVRDLGTQVADANGNVTFTWTISPTETIGTHEFVLIGALSGTASTTFTVVAAEQLPSTGSDTTSTAVLAIVVTIAGVALTALTLRRTHH